MMLDNTMSHDSSHSGGVEMLRSRSRRSRRWSRRSKTLFGLLVFLIMLMIGMATYLGGRIYLLDTENERLQRSLDDSELALAKLRPEVERLRADVNALLEQRVPGLRELVMDDVVTLDDAYLGNIVFTQTRRGSQVKYEYRLTLRNDSLSVIVPRVRLALYDRHGVQIGSSELGESHDGEDAMPELGPGESLARAGTVTIADGEEEPAFFRVRIMPPLQMQTVQKH